MAEFLDRCKVRDVTLGDREHTVRFKRDGTETGVRARWYVDAACKAANTAIRRPKKTLAAAQASYAATLADPSISAPAKNSRGCWGTTPSTGCHTR